MIFAKPDPVIIVSLTFNFFDVHAFGVLNEQQIFDGFSYCAHVFMGFKKFAGGLGVLYFVDWIY